MTRTFISLLCGAAFFTATAWAQSGTISKSDQEFLKMAAEQDMAAAHLGQVAETRSTAPGVKDFGKRLVQDHTSDYRQLCDLAAKAGDTIPKAIDTQNDREIAHLDSYKSNKMFDREFLEHETAEHQKLIAAFKKEAEHGDNPQIRAYATKALPVIEAHLHDAEDLLKPGKHSA